MKDAIIEAIRTIVVPVIVATAITFFSTRAAKVDKPPELPKEQKRDIETLDKE